LTFATIVVAVVAPAFVASLMPAFRASAADRTATLRSE